VCSLVHHGVHACCVSVCTSVFDMANTRVCICRMMVCGTPALSRPSTRTPSRSMLVWAYVYQSCHNLYTAACICLPSACLSALCTLYDNDANHMIAMTGFDGYSIEFDTWIDRDSLRLAPLHKFSETSAGAYRHMCSDTIRCRNSAYRLIPVNE